MKETISKRIYKFLSLNCYLELLSFSLIVLGLVLSVFYYFSSISIMDVTATASPLFYLIFGVVVLCFRFLKITDKEMGVN